jgi:tetratricopeptide (TPR) repeat protein
MMDQGERRGKVIWIALVVLVVLGVGIGSWWKSRQSTPGLAGLTWEELTQRASALGRESRYTEAIPVADRAVRVAEKTFGADDQRVAASLETLAQLYVEALKPVGSLDGALLKSDSFFNPRITTTVLGWLGVKPERPADVKAILKLQAEGKPADAVRLLYQGFLKGEELLQRELTKRERTLGAQSPDVIPFITALAHFYYVEEAGPKAEAMYERARVICARTFGVGSPEVARILDRLGAVYSSRHMDREAIQTLEQSILIFRDAEGPEHPDLVSPLFLLAGIYHNRHQYEQAEGLGEWIVEIREHEQPRNPSQLVSTLESLALTYHAHGHNDKAEPLCRRSLALQEAMPSPNLYVLESSLRRCQQVLKERGQFDEAVLMKSRADKLREQLWKKSTSTR